MNILHVVRPAEGGMKNHIISLLRHLDKSIYHITLACPQKDEWAADLSGTDVKLVELPLKGNLSLRSDIENVKNLMQIIKDNDIHLVHTHGMKAGLVGRIAACYLHLMGGKSTTGRSHVRPYLIATVHNSIYQYPMPRLQRQMVGKVQKCLAHQTDGFITVSQALKKEIEQWEGIPEEKIQVIYNGIKPDFFKLMKAAPQEKLRLGLNPTLPVVGTVARLAPQKGVEYLLRAAQAVLQVMEGVQFLIVGDGPLRKDLENEAERLGIGDRVVFTGHHPDILKVYPCMDVFVMPSLSEGLCISVIEAMAAKIPIAASAVGGLPELIEHRKTGLLVPARSPQALAQSILELLYRPKWAEILAEAAGQKAKNNFTMEKMVQQTADVYRQFYLPEKEKGLEEVEKRLAHA